MIPQGLHGLFNEQAIMKRDLRERKSREIMRIPSTMLVYMVLSHLHGSKRASEQKNEEYGEEQGRKTADKSGNGNLIHVKVG